MGVNDDWGREMPLLATRDFMQRRMRDHTRLSRFKLNIGRSSGTNGRECIHVSEQKKVECIQIEFYPYKRGCYTRTHETKHKR